MMDNISADGSDDSKQKRILMYKNILKYYQGRSLSLDVILAAKQQTEPIPNDMKTYDILNKNTRELHDSIMLLQSLKECCKLIQNTLIYSQINEISDFKSKTEIVDKICGIIYFSESIMKLYKEKLNELDILKKKKNYNTALFKYGEYLDNFKGKEGISEEDSAALEKAELQVYKINLIRAIKEALIAFTAQYHSELLSKFEQFNNTLGGNLTIDDFAETWNVGLTLE